jgi:membrane-bound lytic murein transglycosylase B
VRQALGQAVLVPAVQRLIMPAPAGTARNWAAYRDRFVEPQRIQAGLAFWQRAEPWLQRAQQEYGVPPHIVVGIIGVETFYGRILGNFRVLDALATLSFDFPTGRSDRSAFFRSELEAFLQWCAREQRDPTEPMGSFAGAMGLPQFMPSSILRWAVDFDGDGRIDLQRSPADIVGSVARYLADHGWVPQMPTHFDVQAPEQAEALALLKAPDIRPSFRVAQLQELGLKLPESALAHTGDMAFVELQNGAQPAQHVLGTQNFWVITRYNWSAYYAMAVIALAQALVAARR